jgi:hypothetical protein
MQNWINLMMYQIVDKFGESNLKYPNGTIATESSYCSCTWNAYFLTRLAITSFLLIYRVHPDVITLLKDPFSVETPALLVLEIWYQHLGRLETVQCRTGPIANYFLAVCPIMCQLTADSRPPSFCWQYQASVEAYIRCVALLEK